MQILSFALWQGRSLRVMRVVLWEDGGLSISAMPRLATEVFGGAIACYGQQARNALASYPVLSQWWS